MSVGDTMAGPELSVIVPANNEESRLGPCLDAVCASRWLRDRPVEVIVVPNGCTDDTAVVARAKRFRFEARGWPLRVIELEHGSKLAALNAGDNAAQADMRLYLDADVVVSENLLAQLANTLNTDLPKYASGTLNMTRPKSIVSRAYRRVWQKVPFMTQTVPGCGLFAVNGPGRARWGEFPDIVSDDTFVRLNFAPEERVAVPSEYDWPIVEGWSNLVKVRRRQDRGVAEIEARYPELLQNDEKLPMTGSDLLQIGLRDPLGVAVYAGVALAVRLTPNAQAGWSRGR